jgi:putative ABC transport system ATP-binding protein
VLLDGVYRTYPGHPPVKALKPCTLHIDAGDYLAITGPSGSGKSTLLNLVGLLDAPSGGRYLLGGRDVSALTDGERTALRSLHFGFVFQLFHLLPYRTSLENVELALIYGAVPRRHRGTRASQALEQVGLAHRKEVPPTRLSGGERQRVAIARAFVGQPEMLLCDEPTGNLDADTSASILDLFGELHGGGLTLVVVTHDPEVAARATRKVVLADGVLVEPVR